MSTSAKKIRSLFIRHLFLCLAAERLIEMGDRAQAGRSVATLAYVGARLREVSEDGALLDASAFYSALALNGSQASRAQAEAILEGVASSGSALFRAKALAALGTNFLARNEHQAAKEYYTGAGKLNPGNLTVELIVKSSQATLGSIRGDYRRALREFEALRPLAATVGKRIPFYGINFINSLAVVHLDAGNLAVADEYGRIAVNSPLARPEFHETVRDIEQARERINRRTRLNEATRKGIVRQKLGALLITPEPDTATADQLEAVYESAKQQLKRR